MTETLAHDHPAETERARGVSPERIFILALLLAANGFWIAYFLTVEFATIRDLL